MPSALCLCPDFISNNIRDPQAYASVFIGNIINTDCQIIMDSSGRLEYEYTNAVRKNESAYEFYKAWWGILSAHKGGKILPVNIDLNNEKDYFNIVYDAISFANTTFNRSIVANNNNDYGRYIEELRRQHIGIINLQNIPAYTLPNLNKKEVTFDGVDKDLEWILHRLVRTHGVGHTENDKNDFIRNMMLAKDYFVVDQTREGDSATGIDAGEIDLLINDEYGYLFTIIEALKLSSIETKNIIAHYKKLLSNYNPLSVNRTFLVSYYDGENFSSWWDKYKTLIKELNPVDIGLPESAITVKVDEIETKFLHMKKCAHYFLNDNTIFSCVHYAIKIKKK